MIRKTKNFGLMEVIQKNAKNSQDIVRCIPCNKQLPRNAFSKHKKSDEHLEILQKGGNNNNNIVENKNINVVENNNILDTNLIFKELENIKNEHQQLKNDYINLNSKYNILEQKQTGGNNDQNDILKLKKDIKNITSLITLFTDELDTMKKKQTGGNNDQTKIYYDLKFKLYEKLESHIGGFNKQFDKIYLELNKLKNNKNIFSKNNNVEQNKYNNNFDTLAEITEIKH